MPDPLDEVAAAAAELTRWTVARDAAIRRAREQGASLRTIADAAGLNHQTVANICNR